MGETLQRTRYPGIYRNPRGCYVVYLYDDAENSTRECSEAVLGMPSP